MQGAQVQFLVGNKNPVWYAAWQKKKKKKQKRRNREFIFNYSFIGWEDQV